MGAFQARDGPEPGDVTVIALPNRTNAAWQQVETLTWSGFHFREYPLFITSFTTADVTHGITSRDRCLAS